MDSPLPAVEVHKNAGVASAGREVGTVGAIEALPRPWCVVDQWGVSSSFALAGRYGEKRDICFIASGIRRLPTNPDAAECWNHRALGITLSSISNSL